MNISRPRVSRSIDYPILFLYLALVTIGWFSLYSATYDVEQPFAYLDINTTIGKQTAWVGIAIFVLIITLVLEWQLWNTFAYVLYAIAILALIAVLIFGTEIKGAKSWFVIGGASFQPSELAKFTTALVVSSALSGFNSNLRTRQSVLTIVGLIVLPMILILLQPDAGSAVVFLSFLILLYRNGFSPTFYIISFSLFAIFITSLIYSPLAVMTLLIICCIGMLAYEIWGRNLAIGVVVALIIGWFFVLEENYETIFAIGIAFVLSSLLINRFLARKKKTSAILIPILIGSLFFAFGSSMAFNNVLEPHQQDRINAWLRPDRCDPQGSLYNIIQSKLAIGSGGFNGKGFLEGTMTKLNYVPEQTTDFIFSIVGEEHGFLGTLVVISLFVALLFRIIKIGERGKTPFIRNYAYSLAGIIFLHFFINIGMTVGLMPVIGIPLPFMSKGGSSLLVFTLMIGVLMRMDLARLRLD